MQAVEALSLLIQVGDQRASDLRNLAPHLDSDDEIQRTTEQSEELSLASAICQAMLNTALPVAKYRAFVEVEAKHPKRSAYQESVAVRHEFTVCGVNMAAILSGLIGITSVPTSVKVTVWEQRANGADMISGYQGATKTGQYKQFLQGLIALESAPTVN